MTVNGKVYDWADVDFKVPGLDIEVQEISYDDELDQEAVYGRGNKPRGFGTGNYSSTGKISLLRDDYHKLLAYCKAKGVSFFKLQFPSIVVSYGMEGEKTVVDELKMVQQRHPGRQECQGEPGSRHLRRRRSGRRGAYLRDKLFEKYGGIFHGRH